MIPSPSSSKAPAAWPYHDFNNSCVDCEHSEEIRKLPDDKMTDQCTDQCVVITCDDPEHASMCAGAGDSGHCDLGCDAAVECADCNGFDAFLQCCNDDAFRHEQSASGNASTSNTIWTNMDEWCAICDSMGLPSTGYANPTNAQYQHPEKYPAPSSSYAQSYREPPPMNQVQQFIQPAPHPKPMYTATGPPTSFGPQGHTYQGHHGRHPSSMDYRMERAENHLQGFSQSQARHPSAGFPNSAHGHSYSLSSNSTESSVPPSVHAPSLSSPYVHTSRTTTPAPTFSCMWSACQASFSSMQDLVNHVNINHLSVNSGMTDAPQMSDHKERPCLWGNCDDNLYFSFDDTDQFLNHLLSVHLHPTPIDRHLCSAPQIDNIKHLIQDVSNTLETTSVSSFESTSASTSGSSSPLATPKSSDGPGALPADDTASQNDTAVQPPLENPPHTHKVCTSAAAGEHVHECRWKDCTHPSFSTCDELTAHITEVHIGGGRAHYECFWGDCTRNGDQGFQSKQKICRHVQSHTGHRPFQCSICHQNFSEAATLQQHIRRHTQEKPYVCDFPGCGKSFAITGALTIHKRTHNGDKPFKCSYCDRAFAESSNLSKHLRTHTGARPYECTEPGCGKAFARPDQLNRHKAVHKKQVRGVGGQVVVQ